MQRSPYDIIIRPHITEQTVALSYGAQHLSEDQVVRKYTFVVSPNSNKFEIKAAIESIYNTGKKDKKEMIEVISVRTINVKGKMRRVGNRRGLRPNWKKAIVALRPGQLLEDYGV